MASFPDVYAGKLCAALDRQHPRDLFDVKFLLENEGLTNELRKTFIVFLISHQRPMAELLMPNWKDIRAVYESEFRQMTKMEVPVEELEAAREELIKQIHKGLTENEKRFLLSFKLKQPDWTLLEMDNVKTVSNLPSVKWKMQNLEQMPQKKHAQAFKKLEQFFSLS